MTNMSVQGATTSRPKVEVGSCLSEDGERRDAIESRRLRARHTSTHLIFLWLDLFELMLSNVEPESREETPRKKRKKKKKKKREKV